MGRKKKRIIVLAQTVGGFSEYFGGFHSLLERQCALWFKAAVVM